ncbi:plasmid pRiA4b ORF-3 family protein [Paraburkholderia sp. EG287A]|uniref:plasmid pRiA4b ORF-3 family protein n=1 Tax=unclassified Paraburkholderia TaxID=2615204 RepID=UPI0034D26610
MAKALGGLKSFTYIYDYGDNWEHWIKVEKALVRDPDMRRPLCLDGQNVCPPEDVGGVPEYADFLEAIGDQARDEQDHFPEWCGSSFGAAAFESRSCESMALRDQVLKVKRASVCLQLRRSLPRNLVGSMTSWEAEAGPPQRNQTRVSIAARAARCGHAAPGDFR